jgi:surfeit locus 1 family protein
MPAGYSFRPRLWAAVLAAAACAGGIALGKWQSGRAEEKRALAEHVERVALQGEFLPRHTVYLDNKVNHGRVGYEVITPLRLRNGSNVLVNRGWIAAGKTRDVLPEVRTPAGEVRIEGVALDALPRVLGLQKDAGRIRQTLDVERYSFETGLRFQPRVIQQHSELPDGLSRDWAPRDLGIEKHQGYALQWYSLAALAVILFVVLSFRKR